MAIRSDLDYGQNSHFFGRSAITLIALVILVLLIAPGGNALESSSPPSADRIYMRVSGCDDGCKAFIDGTLYIDVGFAEDSNWLDITEDVANGKRDIRFKVINKTGAITYVFQVRKNNSMIYEQACGTAKVIGCENNRAFRVGIAREFAYEVSPDK
jgi:hypothetical protein